MTPATDPDDAASLHRRGDLAGAEALLRSALVASPRDSGHWSLLGRVLLDAGRPGEAAEALRRALACGAGGAAVLRDLGHALAGSGQTGEAVAAYRRALEHRPDSASLHVDLGNALRAGGLLREAVASYERASERAPSLAAVWNNLGVATLEAGDAKRAVSALECAVARGGGTEAWNNLGNALHASGEPERAIRSYRRSIDLDPANAGAWNNLGIVCADLGRNDEAIRHYRRAVALAPAHVQAHTNLGNALVASGCAVEAVAPYRSALRIDPGFAGAAYGLATTLLLLGEFEEGFERYESRWYGAREAGGPRPGLACAQWNGEPVEGRSILVHAEQGHGDALQFARYVPLLAARGARVVLECQPALARLLGTLEGSPAVITRQDATPRTDLHCPMLSLPRAFGTRLDSIPAAVPYLRASAGAIDAAAGRFREDGVLRVGLVWRGAPANRNDARRSIPVARFAALIGDPGLRWYGLQVDARASGEAAAAGLPLIDLGTGIRDFADTAALLEHLDLVIAVDTAVAHLAGALGRPVWLLCRFESEWRWLLERADSPWYPSMRIFRQPSPDDWSAPLGQVRDALGRVVARRVRAAPPGAMTEAQRAVGQGRIADARSLLENLVQGHPDAPDVHNNLACVLQAAGERGAAARHYLRALALDPAFAEALNNWGTLLLRTGERTAALQRFARAVGLRPDYAEARHNLERARASAGPPG